MKLTILLLLVGLMQVSATVYSQVTKFNFRVENKQIVDVLKEIEESSNFRFFYIREQVNVERKVSVKARNATVEEILEELFADEGINYRVMEDNLVLLSPEDISSDAAKMLQQQKSITGTVTDESSRPLPGVTVVVKGTTKGTVTNTDGNYTISNIPDDATLEFSFVGMKTQEILISGKSNINVTLAEETIGIEEVVAVGYGVQKKVNLTGAISTVTFDEELDNRPITNASQALGGKVTGVWVSQNSGKPGDDGAQLRVRGWGTMNNSNPLVIIDGVEGDFAQINPNDIESISVLKDAASAAIYGSKAANGVILVTTKMGKNNEKMQVTLNSYVGIQTLGMSYNMISNSTENMRLSNQALENEGNSPVYPDYLITAFENGTDPFKYPNTNWNDALFKNAIIQEHNVSIRGGTAQNSSFLSFNYLNQEGMVPNTNSERYGIRANLDSQVNKWLKVSSRFNYIRKVSKEPYADITYGSLGRVFDMLEGAVPFIAPYTRDGNFGSVEAIDNEGNLLYDNRNPLIDAANGQTTREKNYLTVNASAEIKFTNDLLLKTTFASTGNWDLTDRYNKSVFGYTDSGIETITKNFNREGLEINRRHVSSIDNNVFATLNYNKKIAEIHNLSAIAGVQIEDRKIKNVYARRSEPPKEGLTQVDAGTSGIIGDGNMVGLRMFSYFGRINYSLSDKYLFEANLRADASSRFAKGNRWGIFPGFSAGWRLIDEEFIQNLNLFSNLKLRGSWGQLGNQNISGYWPYLTIINQNNGLSYSYSGNFAPGAAVTSLVDKDITWETTTTLDIGTDMGFLNNKINIEADYFKKITTDIIVQLPIPLIMGGLSSPYENVGEMVNNGFELSVNYGNQKNSEDQLGFNIGVNMTYIKNEVTKFRGGDSPDQTYLIREGYSYRTLYGYKSIGIYQTDEEASSHMHSNSYTPKAGNLKFEDVNGDGKLGFEDKQALGNTIPKLTFGLTPSFKYKGFDLNLLFQGIGAVNTYIQNPLTNVTWENRTINKIWRDAWTPKNTDTNIPSIKYNNSWDNSVSSFWVHDISFIKLKNIQLGYVFPRNISSRLGLQKVYVYVNAQNVFTIVNKDYEGWDPERSTFNSGSNMYPIPRITSIGINLNF